MEGIKSFIETLFYLYREYHNGDTKFKKPFLNGKNGMVVKQMRHVKGL